MPSSTSSFERNIPAANWGRIGIIAALLTAAATVAWEMHTRAEGYRPTLNDTQDLWADWRDAVRPDSLVIVGDSRPLFGFDLDALEAGLGKRPVQLSIAGGNAYVILADLAADESFKGDIICSIVPIMYLAPGGPLVANSQDALKRWLTRSPSQRLGHHLVMFLEERIAFLKMEDLNLANLLLDLPIPNRPAALVPPRLPPYFQWLDRERRARMTDECATDGSNVQVAVEKSWQRLFVPPPPPTWVPKEVFFENMRKGTEARFGQTVVAVEKIRARGGRVVFVRFPHTEWLKELEDKATPRAETWDRILRETGAPGVHFEDHPELSGFKCPEWSHLSAEDSVEFSKRIAPHLKRAFAEFPPAG